MYAMKVLKLISRVLLGLVFTFSGFVKAVDPLGSEYKFTDYFVEAFHLPGWASISLPLAIIANSMEFLVGVCLLFNVKPRLSSLGALVFMLIFTPLTFYLALTNAVQDCGCFGDAVKLSNWGTFYKNLIILALSVFTFITSKGTYNTYKKPIDWIIAGSILVLITGFQLYSLTILPIMNFRPYKTGVYIPDQMKMPAGAKSDSFAIFYTMKHLKTNETMKIDDNSYLQKEIWKDTLWQITETSDPVLIKSGHRPPIYNFTAYEFNEEGTENNIDAIPEILNDSAFSFLIVCFDMKKSDLQGFENMKQIINYGYSQNIQSHFLTSSSSDIAKYRTKIPFIPKYYTSDPITLKTIIRSNPGLLLIKKGKILGQWHYNYIPTIEEFTKLINENK